MNSQSADRILEWFIIICVLPRARDHPLFNKLWELYLQPFPTCRSFLGSKM